MRRPRTRPEDRHRRRGGFSFLEAQVAFVLLGLGLAGLGPLIVIQVRLSKKIERGFNPQTAYFRPGTTTYLVPPSSPWERKLGVGAAILASPPAANAEIQAPPAYIVSLIAPPSKPLDSDRVSVRVTVTKRADPGGSP